MDPTSEDVLEKGHYFVYRDKPLGGGTFGQVYAGYDDDKKRRIAVKHLPGVELEYSQAEVDILSRLTEHDNIVRYYGSFVHGKARWIVMQFCDGKTLDQHMELKNPNIEIKREFIEQQVEGLQYMYNAQPSTAHRDLKPKNIIIVRDRQVKLCDFGLAKLLDTSETLNVTTIGGTPNYMAPEVYSGKYIPFPVDIFALGLIIIAMVTFKKGKRMDYVFQEGLGIGREMLSEDKRDILRNKIRALHYPCQQTMQLIKLAEDMVNFDPTKRPNINQVFESLMQIMNQAADADPNGTDTPSSTQSAETRDGVKQQSATTGARHEVNARGEDGTRPKEIGHAAKPKAIVESQEEAKPKQSPVAATKPTGRAGDDDGTRTLQPTGQLGAARPKGSGDGARPKQVTGTPPKTNSRDDDGTRPKEETKKSGDGARPKKVTGAAAKADSRDDDVTGTKENPKGSPSGGAGSMELVDSCDLPFEPYGVVAFSSNGSILLEDRSYPHLYLYELRAGKYSLVWKKEIPSNMRGCGKAVHRTGEILLQQAKDTDTIQYSRDLQEQKTFQRKGRLLGCTDDGHVLYGRGTWGKRDWTIDVWNERECVITLRPPVTEGRVSGSQKRDGWGQYLSACSVGENIVVVEYRYVSLDIFTKQGKRVRHCDLRYEPDSPCAAPTFGTKHVIIAEAGTDVVHVHSLDGREVGRHEFGLQRGDRVYGICSSTDGVLHVAAGPDTDPWPITSLHSYKLV